MCPWCIVGAVAGAGFNAYHQYHTTGNINYKDVAIAGVAGALSGGLGTWAAVRYASAPVMNIFANTIGNGYISGAQQMASNYANGRCLNDGVDDSFISGLKWGAAGAIFGTTLGAPLDKLIFGPRNVIRMNSNQNKLSPYHNWWIGGSLTGNLVPTIAPDIFQ